jgi:predicted ferric reductase
MKLKSLFGWLALIVLSLIPVFLWFKLGAGAEEFVDYASSVHSIGELFGLIGITMFALTFVLSTRIKIIEDIFGGLDKVYIVHGIFGGTALILLLFHPIFLVLRFIPEQISLAASYLLPSSHWSVNFGIIALIGMIILIYITLFLRMKYHRWKFTHEFLGLVFLFAVLHMFLVRWDASGDLIFRGYYIYAAIISIIGLGAFSYSLFLKNRLVKNAVYSVKKIELHRDKFIIEMIPEHKPIDYKSGQFIFIRFYNKNLSKEAHPFSIASKSRDYVIRIVVKKLGDFTEKLEHLKAGDKVSIEGPYGRFHFKNYPGKNQVWIAAGIGIVPFLGMAEDLKDNSDKKIDLYYTAKEDSDFVAYEMLSDAGRNIKGFRFIPWDSSKKGWITAEDIRKISGNFEDKEFFFCGPGRFKESLIHKIIKAGAKKNNIHEEVFDFR